MSPKTKNLNKPKYRINTNNKRLSNHTHIKYKTSQNYTKKARE